MKKKETNTLDFPFYKDSNIKIIDIIVLAICPIFFTIYTFLGGSYPFGLGPYIFCFTQLAAVLFVSRGKISTIIKKPSIRDIIRAILTIILQFIVAIVISATLNYLLKMKLAGNDVIEMDKSIFTWLALAVQLFGEELYKLLIFLSTLIIGYKISKNRTLSLVIATSITLFAFGIIHLGTYNNIIHVLILQGLLSLINWYNYLKTKNIMMSYIQHLGFDLVSILLVMAANSALGSI